MIAPWTLPEVPAFEVVDRLVRYGTHDDPVAKVDNDDFAGIPTGPSLGGNGHLAIPRNGHHVLGGCHIVIVSSVTIVV